MSITITGDLDANLYGNTIMARAKNVEGNLSAIAAERARLEAKLSELNEAERRALEAQRDAGRAVLLAALQKTRIGAMSKSEAKAIAKAIETLGGSVAAERLAAQ